MATDKVQWSPLVRYPVKFAILGQVVETQR